MMMNVKGMANKTVEFICFELVNKRPFSYLGR